MHLYKLSQEINNEYDTYDSLIVCAESEEDARTISPSGNNLKGDKWFGNYTRPPYEEYETDDGSWVNADQVDQVKVEYIGEASKELKKGVVLASFNAG